MRKPTAWGQPCPNPDCASYRLINRGNVSAISTSLTQSGKRRIFRCKDCERTFSETRETAFFDLRTAAEKVMMALKMLLGKVALADMGFVLGVTEATVLEWLRRAAHKAHEINAPWLRDLPVTEVQLDEMWNCIKRTPAPQAEAERESSDLNEEGRQWGWSSFAPEFRLILAAVVGPRTFESAWHRIQMTAAVVLACRAFSVLASAVLCRLSLRSIRRSRRLRRRESEGVPNNR
jgi:transposase-like protein